MLNETINDNPKAMRLMVAAISKIAIASGQGTNPPLMASGTSDRQRIPPSGSPIEGPLGIDPS